MTHACCTHCGLRFAGPPAPEVTTCPKCARPVEHLPPSHALGLRLGDKPAPMPGLATAISAALTPSHRDPDPT